MRKQSALIICIIVVLAGCARYRSQMPSVTRATGVVTLANGQPLRAGYIMLQPVEGTTAYREVTCPIQPDGTFALDDAGLGGVVPGTYTVIIDPDMIPPGAMPDKSANVPKKYRDASTSTLRIEVKSGALNKFELRLNAS
ncbi:MAG TPA: hypothetical protein VGZ47_03895 [Gemmataceae bacterium]|jgi:hypothetical protein|nr:hypothetical protein [Gemmataceae bacterium]